MNIAQAILRHGGLSFVWLSAAACDLPYDPEGTLLRARGGTLRIGAVESPHFLKRTSDGAEGPEAEIVKRFASSIGAKIEWHWGSLDNHMQKLKRFELDVLAGALTESSPWKREVAFTRVWRHEGDANQVLAVPPGENAMLFALDKLIEERAGLLP